MSGWIKLHRQLIDWEWYTDHNTCRLFIHCLLRANHTNSKWRGHTLNRGQFLTSLDTLSKETGLTVSQIRTSLKKLESTNEIASLSQARSRVVTVVHYDSYQDDDKLIAGSSQADDSEIATDKNVKNNNNDKKIKTLDQSAIEHKEAQDYAFSAFWGSGIKKVNKKKAQAIFNKMLNKLEPIDWDALGANLAIDVQRRLNSNQLGFSEMHPTTYLNGERWNDEVTHENGQRSNQQSTGTNRKSLLQRSEDEVRRSLALIEREEIRDGLVSSDESIISTQMGIGERADS